MTSDISILLIEKDKTISNIIKKYLEKKEYKLNVVDSFNDSLKVILETNFNVVIISDSINSIELETIVNKIKTSYPNIIIFLLLKSISSANFTQNTIVFYKPINLLKLEEIIKEKSKHSIHFNFKNKDLFNFINQNAKINQNLLISILDPSSRKLGLIYLNGLNFIHSEYDELIGEDAFYSILELDQGLVSYFEGIEPPIITMNFVLNDDSNEVYKKENPLNTNITKPEPSNVLKNEVNNIESPIPISNKTSEPVVEQKFLKIDDDNSLKDDKNKNNTQKILIVDDETSSVKILSSYLQKKGYQIQVRDSALKGIELLKRESFDVVITDVNMPEMNGIEFLLWIKQYFHKIKVIMITAFGSETVKSFSSQKGAFYFFDKPINFKEMDYLLSAIYSPENFSKDINLIDFIKLSAVSKVNKLIYVSSLLTNNSGYIYLSHGNFLHVEFASLKGQLAIEKILTTSNLIFSEVTWV